MINMSDPQVEGKEIKIAMAKCGLSARLLQNVVSKSRSITSA